MWNRLTQATGIASSDLEEMPAQSAGSNVSQELQEQLEQQQVLIAQLKHLMRENEDQLKNKEKELEENHAKFQKFKLQSKAKITQLTSQLKGHKPKENDETEETVDTDSSRGKVLMLKKQLEESRSKFEKREREMKDNKQMLESVVERLQVQLVEQNKTEQEDNSSSPKRRSQSSNNKEIQEMYAQIVYKDSKILELNNQILENERRIIDLQEHVREKDEVLSSRNKAIQLMSEDLSRRGKTVVDELEDVRSAMKQMQENFAQAEGEWRREKDLLEEMLNSEKEKHELETQEKDRKISALEENVKKVENSRFELAARNAEMKEKVVLQQEKLEKWKAEKKNVTEQEVASLKSQLKEKSQQLEEMQKALKETSSHSDTKVLKARVKERSRAKGLERQLQELQKKDSDQLTALETKVAELEEEKGSLLLKLMDLEEQNKPAELSSEESDKDSLLELQEKLAKITSANEEFEYKLQELTAALSESELHRQDNENIQTEKEKIIDELQTSLKTVQEERVASELKLIEMEEQKEVEENTKQELTREIEMLRHKLDQGSIPVLAIEKEKEALEHRCQQLQLELEAQMDTALQQKSRIEQMTVEMKTVLDEQASLELEKQKLENELHHIVVELSSKETLVSELSTGLRKVHEDNNERNELYLQLLESEKSVKDDLNRILSRCSVESVEDLIETWDVQQKMTKDLGEELQMKCGELSQMLMIHSNVQKQAEEAKAATEDDIVALRDELNNSSAEIERLSSLRLNLQSESDDLRKERDETATTLELLRGDSALKDQKILELESCLSEINEKHTFEVAEKDTIVNNLQSELGNVQRELEVLKDMRSSEEKKIERKMMSLLEQVQEMETALSETQDVLSGKERLVLNLESEMEELQRTNAKMHEEIQKLDEFRENIQKEMEITLNDKESKFMDIVNRLNSDLLETKTELSEMQDLKDGNEKKLHSSLSELTHATEKCANLQLAVEELQAEILALGNSKVQSETEFTREISNVKNDLERIVTEKLSLEEKVQELEMVKSQIGQSHSSLSDQCFNLETELKAVTLQLEEMAEAKEKLSSEIAAKEETLLRYENEKETLLQQLSEKSTGLSDYEERSTNLEKQLTEKHKLLEEYHVRLQDNHEAKDTILKNAQMSVMQLAEEKEMQKNQFSEMISVLQQKISCSDRFLECLELQHDLLKRMINTASSSESNLDKKLKESFNELSKMASTFEQSTAFVTSIAQFQQESSLKEPNAEDDFPLEEDDLTDLNSEQVNLLKQIRHLVSNVANLGSTLSTKTSQLEQLKDIFCHIGKEMEDLQRRMEVGEVSWNNDKQLLVQENERLGSLVHEMTTNSQVLSAEVQASEELTKHLQDELDGIRNDFQCSKKQLESEVHNAVEKNVQVENANLSLNEEVQAARQVENNLRNEKEVLEETLGLLQKELEELSREKLLFKDELETTKRDKNKIAKDKETLEVSLLSCQKEMTTDAVELQDAQLKCNSLEHVIEGLEKRDAESQDTVKRLSSEIERLRLFEAEYHDSVARIEMLEGDLKAEKVRLENYCQEKEKYEELERTQRAEITELEGQVQHLSVELDTTKDHLSIVTTDLSNKNAENETIQEKLNNMETELNKLNEDKNVVFNNNQQLNEKLHNMELTWSQCQVAITDLLQSSESSKQEVLAAKTELDATNKEKIEISKKLDSLESRMAEIALEKEAHQFSNQADDLRIKLKATENSLKELKNVLTGKSEDLEIAKREVEELNLLLSEKDTEISRIFSELKDLELRLTEQSEEFGATLSKCSAMEMHVNASSETVFQNNKTIQELENLLEVNTSELSSLKKQYQVLHQDHLSVTEELSQKQNFLAERDHALLQYKDASSDSSANVLRLLDELAKIQLELKAEGSAVQNKTADLESIQQLLKEKEVMLENAVKEQNMQQTLISEQQSILTKLEAEKQAHIASSQHYVSQLEQLAAENQDLVDGNNNLKNELEQWMGLTEKIQIQLKEKNAELAVLSSELDSVRSDSQALHELQKNYNQAKEKISELEIAFPLEVTESKIEKEVYQRNENYINEITTLQEEKDALRSQLEGNKAKMGKMLMKLKVFKEKNDKLSAEIEKHSSETDVAKLEQLTLDLKESTTRYDADLLQLNEVIDALKKENRILAEAIEKDKVTQSRDAEDLSRALEQLKMASLGFEQLQKDKDKIMVEFNENRHALMEAQNVALQLQTEKENFQQELNMSKEQSEMLVSDNETFQKVVEEVRKSKKNIETELFKMKKSAVKENALYVHVDKMKELEATLAEGQSDIFRLKGDLTSATKLYEDLQQNVNENMAENEKLIFENTQLVTKLENVGTSDTREVLLLQIKSKEDEIILLKKQLDEMLIEVAQLSKDQAKGKKIISDNETQSEQLHEYVDDPRRMEHVVSVQSSNDTSRTSAKEVDSLKAKIEELESIIKRLREEKNDLEIRNKTLSSDVVRLSSNHKEMEKSLYDYHQRLGESEAALVELRQRCVSEVRSRQSLESILNEKERDIEQWTKEMSSNAMAKSHFEGLCKQLLAEKKRLEDELASATSLEIQNQLALELQQAMQNVHQQGLRCEQLNMEVSKLHEEKAVLHQQLLQLQRQEHYSSTEQHNLSTVSTPSDHFHDIALQLEDETFYEKQPWPSLEDQLKDLQRRLAESDKVRDELQKSNEALDEVIQRERTRRTLVEEELSYAQQQIGKDTRSPSKHEYHLLLEEEPEMIPETDFSITRKVLTHTHRLHRWLLGRKNYCSHILRRRSKLHLLYYVYIFVIHVWLLALLF